MLPQKKLFTVRKATSIKEGDEFPCCLFSFTVQETILAANPYALQVLGYKGAEMIGKLKFEALLTTGSKIIFQTHFLPLLGLQGEADEMVLSLKTKKGAELPLLLNIKATDQGGRKIFRAAGLPIIKRIEHEKGLLETLNNAEKIFSKNKALSNLRESYEANQLILEKKLQETYRLNLEHNQLNKVLAHDLQEPVRKILYYASTLSKSNSEKNSDHTKIMKFALKMRAITDSLQRFYSLDYNFERDSKTNLVEVIARAQKKSGADEIPCDMSKMRVFSYNGRPKHFVNLFAELFKNALSFRSETRELKIQIETEVVPQNIIRETEGKYKYEDFLRIRFSDNGLGFDNQHAEKIFDIFQKLHPNEGLGIGLPYCKKLVALYDGTITAKSRKNSGAAFTILLPYQR